MSARTSPFPALITAGVLLLACLVAPASSSASPWSAWRGESEAPTWADFNPDIQSPPWFQTWDAWLWTDDNRLIVVQFLGSSVARRMQRNGSARAAIVDLSQPGSAADRQATRVDRGFDWDKGDWGWNDPPLDLYFLDSHLQATDEGWSLVMVRRELRIEVALTPESPLWRPGSGQLAGGSAEGRLVMLPRARFTGELQRTAEEGPVAIQGVATLQSTWINGFPGDMVQQWTRFTAHRSDGMTILAGEVTPPDGRAGSGAPWVLLLLDGQVVFQSTDVDLLPSGLQDDRRGVGVYALPSSYRLRARNGRDVVELEVRHARMVLADDLLSKLSPLLRAIVSRVMAPMDYEFEATYEATLSLGGSTAAIAGAGWSTLNFAR